MLSYVAECPASEDESVSVDVGRQIWGKSDIETRVLIRSDWIAFSRDPASSRNISSAFRELRYGEVFGIPLPTLTCIALNRSSRSCAKSAHRFSSHDPS